MTNSMDITKARHEELRWLILLALNAARPMGTSEVIIRRAIEPVIPGVTDLEIRREVDYLVERKLAEVERDRAVWFVKINNHGVDLVEYTLPCLPGIARPAKW
jgi:hypothetical protein